MVLASSFVEAVRANAAPQLANI